MVHSFVRVVGFGLALQPAAPFALRARMDGSIDAVLDSEDGEYTVTIDAGGSRQTHDYGDLFDGPELDFWRLEVGGVYAARWPVSMVLRSWPEPENAPFYMLDGGDDVVMYVQGPFARSELPTRDQMVGAGQRELDRGVDGELRWIDAAYSHRGDDWCQRHIVALLDSATSAVVTCQARRGVAAAVGRVALEFARSIEPLAARG